MNDLELKEDKPILSPKDIEMVRQYDEMRKRYSVWIDSRKEIFDEFLKQQGTRSYTQDGITIYKTKAYKKKQVDIKRMKEEGIYDLYTDEIWVDGSVRVQVNYEED